MLTSIITILILIIIVLSVVFTSLLGLLVLYHIAREQTFPADQSNRINKIRLVWFALTREELFVDTFNWLRHDEYDNMNK